MTLRKKQLLLLTMAIVFEVGTQASFALPPIEDTPEEVLRTEIILEARSPITGKPLNAAEYAEIQAKLQNSQFAPQLNSDIQELIFLLQLRKFFKAIIPFY